jgi:hypothetical protein
VTTAGEELEIATVFCPMEVVNTVLTVAVVVPVDAEAVLIAAPPCVAETAKELAVKLW